MDGYPARAAFTVNDPPVPFDRADVVLVARLWVLAGCVRVLKHLLPLPALVRLAARALLVRPRAARAERIRRIARAGRLPRVRLPGNCLDRSLAFYRLLVSAGASPMLVVGLRAAGPTPFAGHVWLRLDGEELGESFDAHGAFAQVLSFDARGRASTEAPSSGGRP
jgi:hypothetical protein